MNRLCSTVAALLVTALPGYGQTAATTERGAATTSAPQKVLGFRDFAEQSRWDKLFLPIPSADLAREHLRRLTSSPHWASSPEDFATAQYVAENFRAAGLETEIVPYSVLMNRSVSISVTATGPSDQVILSGLSPERDVNSAGTSLIPFNGSSPSGDVTAQLVYVNYGRITDFERLASLGISLRGKIALMRYGGDFRGVKVYLAQQFGATGVLLYSDPADGGASEGPTYPQGPYRPGSAVQRGSVQFLPIYPGDPTTPGVASVPGLPAQQRLSGAELHRNIPSIPVTPISSDDATPLLRALAGPAAPRGWQGSLGFPYRIGGTAAVTVHMKLNQDTRLRTVWDVIGRIRGDTLPQELVIAGNHRDAWVYGAADPGSGTAAMLEAVHGLGELRRNGWRPHRTIIICSWDAEEEGLIGSTEWAEQYAPELLNAVAYLNMDVAVSGPRFNAGSVPSLREFLRDITREVPSPTGGSVYSRWQQDTLHGSDHPLNSFEPSSVNDDGRPAAEPRVGDLGSGSDYTPFLQHLGIASTDIASDGPFGVYHTPFDNFDWFTRFADPGLRYTQQQARIFGLEILHMASADVLPYDDRAYGQDIRSYLDQAKSRATAREMRLDFSSALAAATRFEAAGAAMLALEQNASADAPELDSALRNAEHALLLPSGLPGRPWYKHSIYAPGEFTGYAADVVPGVNEAIDAADDARGQAQLDLLTQALDRASAALRQTGSH